MGLQGRDDPKARAVFSAGQKSLFENRPGRAVAATYERQSLFFSDLPLAHKPGEKARHQ